ncbi:hypothetical protein K435DRAFT_781357 [Dendrothele bispora CBS 962.96]|uniref:Uncharacterized protein n=1 Tax=Dendrothele bispora (strain CBS 962.96) TaxID=1314807 RepID=A0A4S8LM45_DENBC|nr:hypothetical protein K435DRAFT_781357 [Dendrothele bispora CBS 962.96]
MPPTLRSRKAHTSNAASLILTDESPSTVNIHSDDSLTVRRPNSHRLKRSASVFEPSDQAESTTRRARKKSRSNEVIVQVKQEPVDEEVLMSVEVEAKREDVEPSLGVGASTCFKSEVVAPIKEEPGSSVKEEVDSLVEEVSVKEEFEASVKEDSEASIEKSGALVKQEFKSSFKKETTSSLKEEGSSGDDSTGIDAAEGHEIEDEPELPSAIQAPTKLSEKGKQKKERKKREKKGPGKKALKDKWMTWCMQHVWPYDQEYKLPVRSRYNYMTKTSAQAVLRLQDVELATLPYEEFPNKKNPRFPGHRYDCSRLFLFSYRKHAAINGVEGALEEYLTKDVLRKGRDFFDKYINNLPVKVRSELAALKRPTLTASEESGYS